MVGIEAEIPGLQIEHDESIAAVETILEEGTWMGLDAGDMNVAAEPAPVDVGHQQRRIARADLDDSARAPGVQEHE